MEITMPVTTPPFLPWVRVFSVFLALLGNQADLGELIGDGLLIFNLESTCVGSRVVRRIFSTLHRTNPDPDPDPDTDPDPYPDTDPDPR